MQKDESRKLILDTMESMLEVQLRSVRRLKKDIAQNREQERTSPQKRTSLSDLCIDILTSEGRPLHLDTLVELLKQRFERSTDRDSLASALAKKARRNEYLTRVAPGTYTLQNKPQE